MADKEAPNYRMSMPAKMGDRGSTSGGYQRAPIARAGNREGNGPQLKSGGMTLQPGPHSSPSMPSELNGFAPLNSDLPPADDAQSQQVDQPPLDIDIGPPPIVATTEEPSSPMESEPVPEGACGPTGGATDPGYAGLTPETSAHPRGYPGT